MTDVTAPPSAPLRERALVPDVLPTPRQRVIEALATCGLPPEWLDRRPTAPRKPIDVAAKECSEP